MKWTESGDVDVNEKTMPGYYAIVPSIIRYCNELKPAEKLMYGEITALSNMYGYCTAGNRYFSKLYGVIPGTVC